MSIWKVSNKVGLLNLVSRLFSSVLMLLTVVGMVKTSCAAEPEHGPTRSIQPVEFPAPSTPKTKGVKLDFDGVDIIFFIRSMGEITGKNFVIDPRVKGNVRIMTPREISKEAAYQVFQSVLEVHGYTTVPAGSVIKVVPSSSAQEKAVDTQAIH